MINNQLYLEDKKNSNEDLYLTFRLSDCNYGVPASQIVEATKLPALISPEKLPAYIIGLVNVRHELLNVIDLRILLGKPVKNYTTENNLLILKSNDKTFAIIADEVKHVIKIKTEHIEKLPYQSENKYLDGIYNSEDVLFTPVNLEKIEKLLDLETEYNSIDYKDVLPANFAQDEISQEKFKSRALTLQKEMKFELNNRYYNEDNFIVFGLNNEKYCVSVKYVKEFTKFKNITIAKIPCVPEYILGLINLRGEFLTLVDIKHFLNIPPSDISNKTKIIVIKSQDLKIGILVDEVFDMVNISHEQLNNDNSAKYEKNKFTFANIICDNKSVMSVLNIEKLLQDERLYIEDNI